MLHFLKQTVFREVKIMVILDTKGSAKHIPCMYVHTNPNHLQLHELVLTMKYLGVH